MSWEQNSGRPDLETTSANTLQASQRKQYQEIKKSGDTYSRAFGTSNRLRKA